MRGMKSIQHAVSFSSRRKKKKMRRGGGGSGPGSCGGSSAQTAAGTVNTVAIITSPTERLESTQPFSQSPSCPDFREHAEQSVEVAIVVAPEEDAPAPQPQEGASLHRSDSTERIKELKKRLRDAEEEATTQRRLSMERGQQRLSETEDEVQVLRAENEGLRRSLAEAEEAAARLRAENEDLRRRLARVETEAHSSSRASSACASVAAVSATSRSTSSASMSTPVRTVSTEELRSRPTHNADFSAEEVSLVLGGPPEIPSMAKVSPSPSPSTTKSPRTVVDPERRKQLVDAVEYVDRVLKRMSIASASVAAAEEEAEGKNPLPPQMVSILSASDLEKLEALAGASHSEEEEESTAYDEEQVVTEIIIDHEDSNSEEFASNSVQHTRSLGQGVMEDGATMSMWARQQKANLAAERTSQEETVGASKATSVFEPTSLEGALDAHLESNRGSKSLNLDEATFVSAAEYMGVSNATNKNREQGTSSGATNYDEMSCFYSVRDGHSVSGMTQRTESLQKAGSEKMMATTVDAAFTYKGDLESMREHQDDGTSASGSWMPAGAMGGLLNKDDDATSTSGSWMPAGATGGLLNNEDDVTSASGSWMPAGATGNLLNGDDGEESLASYSTWDTKSLRSMVLRAGNHDSDDMSAVSGLTDVYSVQGGRTVCDDAEDQHDTNSEVMWELYRIKGLLGSVLEETAAAVDDDGDDQDEKKEEPQPAPLVPAAPTPPPAAAQPHPSLRQPDFKFISALSGNQQNFAISDPTQPDNPIVYVSQGFLDLTGYALNEVLGRNCRFLQGPGTDPAAVDLVRKGIDEGRDTSVCLLNYKADGTTFWNQFFVAALRDENQKIVNYVGVQCEVSRAAVDKMIEDGTLPASAVTNADAAKA